MKILHYNWNSYLEKDIFDSYKALNIDYNCFSWSFSDKNYDEAFLEYFKRFDLRNYCALFSINYWPLLSHVCQQANIPYIAWCYDNPLNVREIELSLGNPVNKVFCFDRTQALNYNALGYRTVFHMPLGVNHRRLSKIGPTTKYSSEISFVGKLYESATDMIMNMSDSYTQGYLQSIINCQQNLYGSFIIDAAVDSAILSHMNSYYETTYPSSNFHLQKQELVYALACEVTRRDRIILLSLCGTRYQTKFYSYNDSSIIKGVERLPSVDYWDEMPYIFASSKINLNPCLRAIQSGIPLRAFDIMGCGGFLLSNYQEELYELFQNDNHLALYDSYEDAIDKIDFYLRNEELRSQIALNGRNEVLTNHTIDLRLKEIFKISGV